jgi:hypothetical protein
LQSLIWILTQRFLAASLLQIGVECNENVSHIIKNR